MQGGVRSRGQDLARHEADLACSAGFLGSGDGAWV